jgi:hypothetical protein
MSASSLRFVPPLLALILLSSCTGPSASVESPNAAFY